MNFRIADTFTSSLARLTAQEQKAVKTTAFDLQMNPAATGLSFHKLDRAKDPNFWSVRVNRDIRLIVHRTGADLLLAYVDHHDDAYQWAERRRLERHPTTGAMQLVEVRERIEEVVAPVPPTAPAPAAPAAALFANLRKPELMAFGVPEEWVEDVRAVTEETLFDVIAHLPQEAQEALLDLAVGAAPQPAAAPVADPFAHPDAQRRFRLLTDQAELARALEFPWEKWTVFLHPTQRALVEREWSGPVRIAGSAGTGKTIVALHRAVRVARLDPASRVLLATFSRPLVHALQAKLGRLVGNEPEVAGRIRTARIGEVAYELHQQAFRQPQLVSATQLGSILDKAAGGEGFERAFLLAEWTDVVDERGLGTWEDYRDVPRLGRKTRLGLKQRERLWAVFEQVRLALDKRGLVTWSMLYERVGNWLETQANRPFTHVVVDEAQDVGIAELRFLARLAGGRPGALFFAGDQGQRIFQQPFSWKALGIDIRGRSYTLKVCYRTSQQIRAAADHLLPTAIADVDGTVEGRTGTVSTFAGPAPEVRVLDDEAAEIDAVAAWLGALASDGIEAGEIGVFVRDAPQLQRARRAASRAGLPLVQLDEKVTTAPGHVAIGTMHLAKGLEFRAVAVMACDDEVLPLASRIDGIGDVADLEATYDTERHLLYVACTRARERLWVSGVDPASEFLDDLG